MFEQLGQKLSAAFAKLNRQARLTEDNIAEALRDVRVALLEADVALPVVKDFIAKVREKAVGETVLRSISPGQQIVKIVHDALVELLGDAAVPLNINTAPPAVILMAGLQGSGKTTTTGKLARRLAQVDKKKVLVASLDTRRPAAQEQLRVLAEQANVASLPIVAGEGPLAITERAINAARLEGYDVLFLDTAGRLSIDDELIEEIKAIKAKSQPSEILLVLDAMTGQDAVRTAEHFHTALGITGTVLTRIDGDMRGGAALSLRAITGAPIKFLGTGEKLDGLEVFHPDRLAGRILGMGDVVSLVEQAAATIDQQEAEKLAAKMQEGEFDLNDLASQLGQMQKMGGLSGLMNFLPGAGQLKAAMSDAKVDDRVLQRQRAIISSMTPAERKKPDLLNASRKRRVATGSGVTVADVNKLLKQHQQMRDMMRQLKKMGMKGMMRQMGSMLKGGGGGFGGGNGGGFGGFGGGRPF